MFGFRHPNHALRINSKAVWAARFFDYPLRRTISADVSHATALRASLDDQPGSVRQRNWTFRCTQAVGENHGVSLIEEFQVLTTFLRHHPKRVPNHLRLGE